MLLSFELKVTDIHTSYFVAVSPESITMSDSIAGCEKELREAGLPENIMVDCSHANSQSDPDKQLGVLEDITQQILEGNQSIIGLMLESNIERGKQVIPSAREALEYGVSITDACINWRTTESVLKQLREKLKGSLLLRRKAC